MRTITPVFDYFVIATGNSRRQLHAISEEIEHVLEDELKDKRMGIEGYEESRWILLDYGNVVIHLFDQETHWSPLKKFSSGMSFCAIPLGVYTLGSVVSRICKSVDFTEYLSNLSV